MVGARRPESATKAGALHVAVTTQSLRRSKSQPLSLAPSQKRWNPKPAGENRAPGAVSTHNAQTTSLKRGHVGVNKALTWHRLPAVGGWVPPARTGHSAVLVGTEMVVFGGIVNGRRVSELAVFDLSMRAWRRVTPLPAKTGTIPGMQKVSEPPPPRAFHAAWAVGDEVHVHGGEGCNNGSEDNGVSEILGGVGHDPFAEGDGGVPLEEGRVVMAAETVRKAGSGVRGSAPCGLGGPGQQNTECSSARRRSVSILEDLWKFDMRILRWERLSSRLAPLGRKGHTATLAPFVGALRVFLFGGAPAGRRGLSNALYSVEVGALSGGDGTWERHRPGGTTPAARHGHSFTAIGQGERLVLFGGVGDKGELLNDIQILEAAGGHLAWASVQAAVGDVPSPRRGHSACEVSAAAGTAIGFGDGGGLIVFGGEGREESESELRSTNSHAAFVYEPEASRWRAVQTGHAFPIGRHGHSMAVITGWTPPPFHPDGTLVEGADVSGSKVIPGLRSPRGRGHRIETGSTAPTGQPPEGKAAEAAARLWGNSPPACAIVFGGLNSMYVAPEVWLLPLRWREKMVHFSAPIVERGQDVSRAGQEAGKTATHGLGFAAVAHLKQAAAVAAELARKQVAIEDERWRPSRGTNIDGGRIHGGPGDQDATKASATRHRRASFPTAAYRVQGGLSIDTARYLDVTKSGCGAGRGPSASEAVTFGTGGGRDEDCVDAPNSAAEVETELLRLRKLTFAAEHKLSAEVAARRQLEDVNQGLRAKIEDLQRSHETSEARLREDVKRQWRHGQQAKAQCGRLEKLLSEAYELINLAELQHHLQIKSLMSDLYGGFSAPRADAAGVESEASHERDQNRNKPGCSSTGNECHGRGVNHPGAATDEDAKDGCDKRAAGEVDYREREPGAGHTRRRGDEAREATAMAVPSWKIGLPGDAFLGAV